MIGIIWVLNKIGCFLQVFPFFGILCVQLCIPCSTHERFFKINSNSFFFTFLLRAVHSRSCFIAFPRTSRFSEGKLLLKFKYHEASRCVDLFTIFRKCVKGMYEKYTGMGMYWYVSHYIHWLYWYVSHYTLVVHIGCTSTCFDVISFWTLSVWLPLCDEFNLNSEI